MMTWQRIATRLRMEWYALLAREGDFYKDMDYPKAKLELYQGIRFNSCDKEPETVRWIETFKKDEVFYDIGACAGAYSLVASRHVMAVYAFEPAFFNYNVLMRNVHRNVEHGNIVDNIIAVPNPLDTKTGKNNFNYLTMVSGSSMHVLGSNVDYNGDSFVEAFSQPSFAYALDDFISTFGILQPNHIKLDVDGNELAILKGASRVLGSKNLRSLMVEVDIGRSNNDIVKLLSRYGFILSDVTVRRKEIANYLFRRVA